MSPTRIQRRRTAGWTAPLDAQGRKPVYVGRGSQWGNPWVVIKTDTGTGWAVNWAGHTQQQRPKGLRDFILANDQRDAHTLAVELFEIYVNHRPQLWVAVPKQLAGRDLMCWCAESLPCHAAVLLALANEGSSE
ncbi:DUF4326 domain-containing protein (plasmid) [Streptomyces seoulensis]|uniref:DUF4326 domain-containing protein n=1 Tax=Streptomyces seoulensis TaxID=73044 RepID=A0A4P6U873_STRSO|nr:DUF4326 domain-containing protein [Streptomyces seoulensis]QBJ94528.1 DUF4326 domain-containing protein [Streptomyces seoulensis]